MDRRIWTSWVGRSAIHDWRVGLESRNQKLTTIVGAPALLTGEALSCLFRYRLVSMMAFMVALWWLVPASPRRVD